MKPHPLPSKTTAAIRIPALRLLLALAAPVLLCQCGSTRQPPLSSGESFLDATPDREHRDRISNQRIVAVNGNIVSKTEARLPAGLVNVAVTFPWPQGGEARVPLQFYAAAGTHHIINYTAYPHEMKKRDPDFGDFNRGLMEAGAQMNYAGVPLIGAAILVGTTKIAAEALTHNIPSGAAATHVDVSVISSNPTDGIIRTARVYPNGRVITKPWDKFAKTRP